MDDFSINTIISQFEQVYYLIGTYYVPQTII